MGNVHGMSRLLSGIAGKGKKVRHYSEPGYHLSKQIANLRPTPPPVKISSHQNPQGSRDAAQFDILVTRQTNNIAQPLQIAVFGQMHSDSAYFGIVQPAAGGSFACIGGRNSAAPNSIRFTHTVGADVDIIDITCNQVSYPSFLQATTNDLFKISNVRYQIINPLDTIQFTQLFSFNGKTLFGKTDGDTVSVGAYKKPEQYQPGIIDIPTIADIDKERYILMNMSELATAYPFTVQLSMFVERYDKYNARNVLG